MTSDAESTGDFGLAELALDENRDSDASDCRDLVGAETGPVLVTSDYHGSLAVAERLHHFKRQGILRQVHHGIGEAFFVQRPVRRIALGALGLRVNGDGHGKYFRCNYILVIAQQYSGTPTSANFYGACREIIDRNMLWWLRVRTTTYRGSASSS